MKKWFILVLFALIPISYALGQNNGTKRVAIYVTGDVESGYKKVIGSKLVTGITRSDDYVAVERTADFLSELAREQDYQMSGAVSDSQIARIGQQLGVQYVLVADISEIFESIFISARMIDVQTAQILKSAEADRVINGLEDLTHCADSIVVKITSTFSENDIKIMACYTFDDLLRCCETAPEGYHIATNEEIEDVIKIYGIMNQKLSLPIYADIKIEISRWEKDISEKKSDRRTGEEYEFDLFSIKQHISDFFVSFIFIENEKNRTTQSLSYRIAQDMEDYRLTVERIEECRCELLGVEYGTAMPQITPGYIYLIKNM